MLEVSISCVIVLAIGYGVTLWLMGRHDDVLHGDFVQAEQRTEAPPERLLPPTRLPSRRAGNEESLQSLLATIKRDLKDAAQL
jgi:hypothetical protein